MAPMRETKDKPAPTKPARPILYTPEIGEKICEIIASGESLVKACEADDMPAISTVWSWIRSNNDNLQERHRYAREQSAWSCLEKLIQVENSLEKRLIDSQAARVMLDSIRWRMSKVLPLIFGDTQPNQTPQLGPITITAVMGFQPSETGQIVVNPTPINVQVTDKPNENNQLPEPVR